MREKTKADTDYDKDENIKKDSTDSKDKEGFDLSKCAKIEKEMIRGMAKILPLFRTRMRNKDETMKQMENK